MDFTQSFRQRLGHCLNFGGRAANTMHSYSLPIVSLLLSELGIFHCSGAEPPSSKDIPFFVPFYEENEAPTQETSLATRLTQDFSSTQIKQETSAIVK